MNKPINISLKKTVFIRQYSLCVYLSNRFRPKLCHLQALKRLEKHIEKDNMQLTVCHSLNLR